MNKAEQLNLLLIDCMEVNCSDALWAFKSNASAIEDCRWNAEHGGTRNEDLIRQCELLTALIISSSPKINLKLRSQIL